MNWQSFKSLYEIYTTGKTKISRSLAEDAVFKYLAHQTKELLFTKKEIIVNDQAAFENTFRVRYATKYEECVRVLEDIGENIPQCRFHVDDILILKEMQCQMASGQLEDIRQQIITSNETRRGVSLMFFKNEKHLDNSGALERAVKKILNIEDFADNRDFQYLYVLQCHNPRAIILCENLYFLKMPEKARKSQFELWYAGGRNVEKLEYSGSRDIPTYYLCDWDHDGLDIYAAVKAKLPYIELLTPNGGKVDITRTEHKSLWKNREDPALLSGLAASLFTDMQKKLIQSLITENAWIVEESNDLVALVN